MNGENCLNFENNIFLTDCTLLSNTDNCNISQAMTVVLQPPTTSKALKKRRSTFGKERYSAGKRYSVYSCMQQLDIKDCVRKIPADLSPELYLLQATEICIRHTANQLENNYPDRDYIRLLRADLILNSKSIAEELQDYNSKVLSYNVSLRNGDIAEAIISQSKTKQEAIMRYQMVMTYKSKAEKLRKEYDAFSEMRKERKHTFIEAKKDYDTAKKGELFITDEQYDFLSDSQKEILNAKPNYNRYLKEAVTAMEECTILFSEIHRNSMKLQDKIMNFACLNASIFSTLEKKIFGSNVQCSLSEVCNMFLLNTETISSDM